MVDWRADWSADGTDTCAICNKRDKQENLVVCRSCFNRVMSVKTEIIPVLFSKWSKEDAV
jgi:hypothetical protein